MTVNWQGEEFQQQIRQALGRGVFRGTELVREEVLRLILDTPKTGALYLKPDGRIHQASAPGEAPASDTGTLVSRITADYDPSNLRGLVGARTFYAAWLEFGTKSMKSRPYMRRALGNKSEEIIAEVAFRIREVVGPGGNVNVG